MYDILMNGLHAIQMYAEHRGERPSLRVGVFRVERGSKIELAKILSCICGTNGESY